jgi:hypothetical protein
MADQSEIKVGQRVKFESSQSGVTYTGTVTATSKDAGVTVKTDASKGNVSHLESTHAHKITILEGGESGNEKEKENQGAAPGSSTTQSSSAPGSSTTQSSSATAGGAKRPIVLTPAKPAAE